MTKILDNKKVKKFILKLNDKDLIVEIRNLAEQASGSCFVRYGDTQVLATAVMSEIEREGIDYFPLMVNYEERYYARGRILGSRYIRRESRPSDEAILTSRLIDRVIRPRFPKNFKKEVQVIITCLSWDKENDPDIIGLLAASISLLISDIPWAGPTASLRIGKKNGKFILNPTYSEREGIDLDLTIGVVEEENNPLINMIEAEGEEVKEEMILEAIEYAKPYIKNLFSFQKEIKKQVGKEKFKPKELKLEKDLEKEIKDFLGNELVEALFQEQKGERAKDVNEIKNDLLEFVEEKYPEKVSLAKEFFEEQIDKIIHEKILSEGKRTDGRKINEIRPLFAEVGLVPRTHGSGLFIRGQTKTLSTLTLGAPGDVKLLEGMEVIGKKRFMHHYNFPPYSVGEVKPIRGPGRREIGHGILVERALLPVVPSSDDFPYTIRVVSEVLSSNGSSSMASVCSSSLALMDAGVPIKSPVAGIALGLMVKENYFSSPASAKASAKEGKDYKILTDIQGPEDHYGEMDLKIAGTKKGVTAIQMDSKINGISANILKEGLDIAKKARLEILKIMEEVISGPRKNLSPLAPRILTLQINPEKIREVIGKGGKTINEIIEECGVSIDIEDTGKIFVTSESEDAAKKAVSWIKNITREIKVGEVFQGRVKRILDFGAFVEIVPGQEGLIHISKLAPWRVEKVEDVVKTGDMVEVKVISIDEQGRINLALQSPKKKKNK